MKATRILTILVVALGLILCQAKVSEAVPMGTAFTYQGHLYDSNHVADGLYDFQFKLYDANTAGSQLGSDVNKPDVDVISAYFTVELDFGSGIFTGYARWLEIGVRAGDSTGSFTTLTPRQELTPAPYAIYARRCGYAWDADSVDGYDAGDLPYVDGGGTAECIAKFVGPNSVGDSAIYESAGNVGIGTTEPDAKLEVNGDLKVTGAYKGNIGPNGGAPFPRPAYDSGWLTEGSGVVTLFHNIGGNVDNYVVQSEYKADLAGWHYLYEPYYNLTTNSVEINVPSSAPRYVRIRIWVYN